ncbi:hypothetical protein ACFPU1_09510 [Thalassorhabdus alkalitolerans]|uniref:Uncharacterized protein n=1 Tax=Thalassorhabdus alkalitolerans TaxID=2282697 RepID=A0ABW0YKW0_9BACI|nr:hypothetical protein [Thalassobacillus sp. C254]
MIQALIFGIAVFLGWILLDWVKEKKLRKEKVREAAVTAVFGAIGWLILDFIL